MSSNRSIIQGKDYLTDLQTRESERTGISSLKVSYNNVFGYYIEVRNTHKDKVPPEWIEKADTCKCRKVYNRGIKGIRGENSWSRRKDTGTRDKTL